MNKRFDSEKIKSCFDISRMTHLTEEFSEIGADPDGGVTRLAFSREDLEARNKIIEIFEKELQLRVRTDALGNIFGSREGERKDLPVLMTGSHLDSVRNGGKFDGPAGVLGAVEVVRVLNELEIGTKHPLELVVTCSEEPNSFGISTFGSRGMVAKLTREDLQQLRDEDGRPFKEALAFVGGNMDEVDQAVRKPGEIAAFVEIHIEQMPNLYEKGIDIGIVDGITGICRKNIKIRGEASHGGTTPMSKRKDALCAASEIVLALEKAAKEQNGKALATVGHVMVFPNAINITPSMVDMIAEIRSFYPEYSKALSERLDEAIEKTIKQRGVGIQTEVTYDTNPVHFPHHVKETLRKSCQFFGLSHMGLYSMAGHDAAHMAEVTQAGMIFIPCRDGISHRPDEWTEPSSIIKGAQVLLGALLLLDSS